MTLCHQDRSCPQKADAADHLSAQAAHIRPDHREDIPLFLHCVEILSQKHRQRRPQADQQIGPESRRPLFLLPLNPDQSAKEHRQQQPEDHRGNIQFPQRLQPAQHAENLIGRDSFQEVDFTGISMPITKCNYLVKDVNQLADIIREAFAIARSSRPGPVLIDIAKNVTSETAEYEFLPLELHASHGRLAAMQQRSAHDLNSPQINLDDIETLRQMIAEAQRPMVVVGGGVIRSKGAVPEFRKFVETLGVPTAITLMGAGALPGNHPLTTGMIGMHGSRASNLATGECDLLIAIGCRFSDRVATSPASFAHQAKIVHIDIDRSEIDKNVLTDRCYSAFLSALYDEGFNLSHYLLREAVLSETIYLHRLGTGQEIPPVLQACVDQELSLLDQLSHLSCEALQGMIQCPVSLPENETTDLDFSAEYHRQIATVGQRGWGLFAQHTMFRLLDGALIPACPADPTTLGSSPVRVPSPWNSVTRFPIWMR